MQAFLFCYLYFSIFLLISQKHKDSKRRLQAHYSDYKFMNNCNLKGIEIVSMLCKMLRSTRLHVNGTDKPNNSFILDRNDEKENVRKIRSRAKQKLIEQMKEGK